MTEEQLKNEIFSRYGAVTRARGCFLYTKKGVRLTDLYQADGRAILGWGGSDAWTRFKNVLNRGLTGSFKTEYSSQIERAVSELLQDDRYVIWGSELAEEIPQWEPWNENGVSLSEVQKLDVVCIKPVLPWTNSLWMYCVKNGVVEKFEAIKAVDIPSPVSAAVTRSIYDLIGAIKERQEKDWFIYDQILCRFFTREGPYLYPKMNESDYDQFVLTCLDSGIIINPDYKKHSIVPFGADKGVFSKLNKL